MKNFIGCRKCKDNPGFLIRTVDGIEVKLRCDCWKRWARNRQTQITLEKSDVPIGVLPFDLMNYDPEKDYIGNTTKKTIVPKLKTYVEHFEERFSDKLLYFSGDSGTQKTTLACWIARCVAEKGKSVKYILMNDLLRILQKADFDDAHNDKAQELYKVDLLILDRAFDKSQVNLYKSGYQLTFLDTFLRKRVEQHGKAMIIVSNTPVENIPDHGYTKDSMDFILRKVLQADTQFEFKDRYTQKDDFQIDDLWS